VSSDFIDKKSIRATKSSTTFFFCLIISIADAICQTVKFIPFTAYTAPDNKFNNREEQILVFLQTANNRTSHLYYDLSTSRFPGLILFYEYSGPVAQIQNKVSCRGEACFALPFRAIRKGRASSAPTKAEIFGNEIVWTTGPSCSVTINH
jgi:hypothetical protein